MKKLLRSVAVFSPSACLLALLALTSRAALLDLDDSNPRVRSAMAHQASLDRDVFKWRGVIGTAISAENDADDENPTLTVYVDEADSAVHQAIRWALPLQLGSHKVKVEYTGKVRALALQLPLLPILGKPVNHKGPQALPIQLGTSGGWRFDLANGYCCGGTLGSLIKANGVQYILSNYHVFEADIFSGGNGITVTTGDPIVQPGLIDVNCNAAGAKNVGTVRRLSSLPGSNVDVGVAQVTPGAVSANGAILEIGALSSQTVAASLNKAVKKSGRTTGLTRSKITGLNATIQVAYENECAGGTAFTKVYSGQIVIRNTGSRFLAGGDSGSLLVEDVTTKPRAVGLLFAGSNTTAIANPIGEVLSFLSGQLGGTATMVGN